MSSDTSATQTNADMIITGVSYEQLLQLLSSSTVLEPADVDAYKKEYATKLGDQQFIDATFTLLLTIETRVLEMQIAELKKATEGPLKDDKASVDTLSKLSNRLATLSTLVDTLAAQNKFKALQTT